jgi:uncharacterized protein (DUF433 family)
MLDWSSCSAVERTPDKVSGVWVFRGTRVPVKALFENLEDGASVDNFLEWFPGVTKDQVDAVLEHASRSLELELALYPCKKFVRTYLLHYVQVSRIPATDRGTL